MRKNLILERWNPQIRRCWRMLLPALVCLGQSLMMAGQNINRPNIQGPYGLQANSYTGNLFFERKDLYIPGRGLSIDISFAYNSSGRTRDDGFGFGWSFNYSSRYRTDSAGIAVIKSDGREDLYLASGGAYIAPKGIFDRLVMYEQGKFKVITKDKTEYFYEDASHKKLTRIRDRNGNEMVLAYTGGNLVSITDPSGRVVALTWTAGKLDEIRTVAPMPARSIKYLYNQAACLTSVKDPMNNITMYTYAPGRLLNGVIDKNGNPFSITYNNSSAVIKFVSCESEKNISYNAAQKKTYLTEKNGSQNTVTIYSFDDAGRLVERSGNCCGYKNTFSYDDRDNISKRVDADSNISYYTFDARGNVLTETDGLGGTTHFMYDTTFGAVKSTTDKNGNTTEFVYDSKGNLTETHYPLNITTKYSYDAFGNKTSYTDGRNNTTLFGYNVNGYLESLTNPDGGAWAYEYDQFGNLLSQKDANDNITNYTYDELNRQLTRKDAANNITTLSYDANGNLIAVKDPALNISTMVYDASNRLIKYTDPLGQVTQQMYDGVGNRIGMIDMDGRSFAYTYDNMRRLVSETNGAGETTGYTYNGKGNVTSILLPNGNIIRYSYDALGRVLEIKDNFGKITSYTYDANSNRLTETSGDGNTWSYQYDALSRLTQQLDPDGKGIVYTYDASNNLLQEKDRNGNITTFTYDAMNRQRTVKDGLNFVIEQTYDLSGNILTKKDARGNITQYSYNNLQQITVETFADNTTRQYTYDIKGNLVSQKDNTGVVTVYRYDKLNRLVSKSHPGGIDSFAYEPSGLIKAAINANATVYFSYDAAGRKISENLNGKVTGYSYDIEHGIQRITYPSGNIVTKQMGPRDQLLSVDDNGKVIIEITHDENSRVKEKKLGNGLLNSFSYTSTGNLLNSNVTPGQVVDMGYSYDNEDNPRQVVYNEQPGRTEEFGYDKLNQLISFKRGAQQSQFNYDGVGNRTTSLLNGVTTTYGVNNMNAYTSIIQASPIVLSYDVNGNLAGDGVKTYQYDYENRMVSVNSGSVASYRYDALGRRVQKNLPGDTAKYFFDGLDVVEEYDAASNLLSSYTWGTGIDNLILMKRNGQQYYFHSNAVGSIIAVTDSAGVVVERYDYDAFGKLSVLSPTFQPRTTSVIHNRYAFTGREYDEESGFYYYRARTYNPNSGQFCQRDPLGYVDGMAMYKYASNRPTSLVDPLGTRCAPMCRKEGFETPEIDLEEVNAFNSKSLAVAELDYLRRTKELTNNEYWFRTKTKGYTFKGTARWNKHFTKMHREAQMLEIKRKVPKAGKLLPGLGVAMVGANVYVNQEVKPSDAINTILIGASLTPWGAIIGGVYLLTDVGLELATGKGLGDRIDDAVGCPIYSFKDNTGYLNGN